MSSGTAACSIADEPKGRHGLLTGRSVSELQRAIGYAGAVAVVGLMMIPLDHLAIRVTRLDGFPGELEVLLNRIEPFGHGYGILLIATTLWIVGQIGRRQVAMLLCCSLGSGITADFIKLFIGRIRPHRLPEEYSGSSFLGLNSFWDLESARSMFESANHSFPSAHTATAFGLAFGLASLYPTGRWWFLLLAGCVGLQRVVSGYHYPSDTIIGASLGLAIGSILYHRYFSNPRSSMDPATASIPRV